ncbi:hypothetical protein ACFVP0_31565, partial [Streptomyces cinereoruber]|uniref:hypothetical protein n=1 Tax=Streptomyces cinereoruber TaxID=67260 RepID=UPI0036C6FF78
TAVRTAVTPVPAALSATRLRRRAPRHRPTSGAPHMSTGPIPAVASPRTRRRVVHRDGACSTVHRFRHAAARLEAFRTGRQ